MIVKSYFSTFGSLENFSIFDSIQKITTESIGIQSPMENLKLNQWGSRSIFPYSVQWLICHDIMNDIHFVNDMSFGICKRRVIHNYNKESYEWHLFCKWNAIHK